jgi:DNA polymerase III alpha subunit
MPPVLSSAQGVQDCLQIRSKFRATYQRQTKKGEEMAWLSISDAFGSVSCAIFPNAYQRLGQPAQLREGAFLVARGRLAHEEATGTNVWVDSIVPLSGAGAHLRAVATAVEPVQNWVRPAKRTSPLYLRSTKFPK